MTCLPVGACIRHGKSPDCMDCLSRQNQSDAIMEYADMAIPELLDRMAKDMRVLFEAVYRVDDELDDEVQMIAKEWGL